MHFNRFLTARYCIELGHRSSPSRRPVADTSGPVHSSKGLVR